jgi:hypothetical protein
VRVESPSIGTIPDFILRKQANKRVVVQFETVPLPTNGESQVITKGWCVAAGPSESNLGGTSALKIQTHAQPDVDAIYAAEERAY